MAEIDTTTTLPVPEVDFQLSQAPFAEKSPFEKVQDYFGDSFYEKSTNIVNYSGYQSEQDYNRGYVTLPFDCNVTTYTRTVKPSAIAACVLICLVLVTIFTSIKGVLTR